MITNVDLGPVPTVILSLKVHVPLGTGGWAWGQLPWLPDQMARDYVYNAHECESLVHTFGRMVPLMWTAKELGESFMICARGPVTGLAVGLREWAYDPVQRAYLATGDYMCGWREAARSYYRKTGEVFEGRKFDAQGISVPALTLVPVAA